MGEENVINLSLKLEIKNYALKLKNTENTSQGMKLQKKEGKDEYHTGMLNLIPFRS